MPKPKKSPSSADVTPRPGQRGRVFFPLAVGAAALILFLITLAPTVTAEDSGELIAAAWHFGIPHPPGYPLWTILCGALVHLGRADTSAYLANLFSALCGTAAAVVAYAAIRELGVSRAASAGAALVWIWSRFSWSQCVITEVYALNSLLTAGVLWCGLRWRRTRKHGPLLIASILMGLGMSNHHTIALAGLAVVVWILAQQPSLMIRWRLVLACVGLFIAGLSPYSFTILRAREKPAINWGDPSTLQRAWEHVSRHQYGTLGVLKVADPRSPERFLAQMEYFGECLLDDMTPALAVAAAVGVILMSARPSSHGRALLLVVLWLLCTGVLFALISNYDLDRTSQWAMRVYFIPVWLALVIPIAYLLEFLIGLAGRIAQGPARIAAVALLAVIGPAVQVYAHWKDCNYRNYWYAYDHGRNLLKCMIGDSMIFPSGDHNAFPLVYLVMVERQRSDILIADIYGYVSPELYTDRPPNSQDDPMAWLIKTRRKPVYFTTKQAPPVGNAEFVTAGLMYHLLPNGKTLDTSHLLETCAYRNVGDPSVQDFGAAHIMTDYEFFSGLDRLVKQDIGGAMAHFERAASIGQGIKEVYNNIGSALGEHGLDAQAIGYFEQAARLDWRYPMPRWNLYRVYMKHERWLEAQDRLRELIRASPDDARPYREMGFLLGDHLNDRPGALHYWQESLARNPAQPDIVRAINDRGRGDPPWGPPSPLERLGLPPGP